MHSVAKIQRVGMVTDYTCVLLNINQVSIMKKNLVVLCLGLATLSACEMHYETGSGEKIIGSGKIITEQRPVSAFTTLENDSFFQVIVTAGDKDDIEISGDEKLVPQVETVVEGERLIIRNKNKTYRFSWKTNPGTINITAAHLQSLENGGSGDIELRNMNTDKFNLKSNSSGDIKASGKIASLNVASSGSGDLDLAHLTVGQATLELNGPGDLTLDTVSGSLSVKVNGSGGVDVRSLQDAKVDLMLRGPGDTKLRGSIKAFNVESSGSGDLDVDGLHVAQADLQLLGPGSVRLSGEADVLNLTVSGSGDVETTHLHTKSVILKNQGPADININIDQNLKADLSGSGDLKAKFTAANNIELLMNGPGTSVLSGTANSLVAKVNGSGDLHASDLLLRSASIKVNGPGEAAVNVRQTNGPRVVHIDRNGVVSE